MYQKEVLNCFTNQWFLLLSGQLNYDGKKNPAFLLVIPQKNNMKNYKNGFSESLNFFYTKYKTDLLAKQLLFCHKTSYLITFALFVVTYTLMFVSKLLYPIVTFKLLSIAQTCLEETSKDSNCKSVVITYIVSSLVASLIYRLVIIILFHSKYPSR